MTVLAAGCEFVLVAPGCQARRAYRARRSLSTPKAGVVSNMYVSAVQRQTCFAQ